MWHTLDAWGPLGMKKELGGLLQLQKHYSTTDSREARNYELMKETSKTSLIENLHSQVQRHIYIKDLRGPPESLAGLIGEDLSLCEANL